MYKSETAKIARITFFESARIRNPNRSQKKFPHVSIKTCGNFTRRTALFPRPLVRDKRKAVRTLRMFFHYAFLI